MPEIKVCFNFSHNYLLNMELSFEKKTMERFEQLEAELQTLKEGYLVVNKRYAETLISMKQLTSSSLEAASRAAVAAEKSAQAARNSADAAIGAANEKVLNLSLIHI